MLVSGRHKNSYEWLAISSKWGGVRRPSLFSHRDGSIIRKPFALKKKQNQKPTDACLLILEDVFVLKVIFKLI